MAANAQAFKALAADAREAEAIRRGNAFLAAGADCVFVPFVTDREAIARLAKEIRGPLNILAGPASPELADLERTGVRRVSVGSSIARAAYGLARSSALALLRERPAVLAALRARLAKALSGQRQLVFVTGEPGIGKTALVETFLAEVGEAFLVVALVLQLFVRLHFRRVAEENDVARMAASQSCACERSG